MLTKPLNRSLCNGRDLDTSKDALVKAVSLEQTCSATVKSRIFLDTDNSTHSCWSDETRRRKKIRGCGQKQRQETDPLALPDGGELCCALILQRRHPTDPLDFTRNSPKESLGHM